MAVSVPDVTSTVMVFPPVESVRLPVAPPVSLSTVEPSFFRTTVAPVSVDVAVPVCGLLFVVAVYQSQLGEKVGVRVSAPIVSADRDAAKGLA